MALLTRGTRAAAAAGWLHRRRTDAAGRPLFASGAARGRLHRGCYQGCDPVDAVCAQTCDSRHPPTAQLQTYGQVAAAVVEADAAKREREAAQGRSDTPVASSSHSSAQRSLTINGQTYTGGEHLGRPCTLDEPCPTGYACHLATDRSGQCVQ